MFRVTLSYLQSVFIDIFEIHDSLFIILGIKIIILSTTLCKYISITKRVFLHYLVSDPKRVLFAAIWICTGGKKVKNSAAVETSSIRTLTRISSISINCTMHPCTHISIPLISTFYI